MSLSKCYHMALQSGSRAARSLLAKSVTGRWLSSAPEAVRTLPWQYLRESDPANFDRDTHQRAGLPYDIVTGKPFVDGSSQPTLSMEDVSVDGDDCTIVWSDGRSSTYSMVWLEEQAAKWTQTAPEDRVFWSNLSADDVRNSPEMAIKFSNLKTDEGMKQAVTALYKHGILLVTETPIDDNGAGVALLSACLGGGSSKDNPVTSIVASHREGGSDTMLEHGTDGPLRTLYGSVWATSATMQSEGTSFADSAYGNEGLPLHNDTCYLRDPCGLQIFTMVQPAAKGGESTYGDGFAIAEELRKTDPEAFETLSTTIRRYRCLDKETGWTLHGIGPVIQVDNGKVVAIRHNDLDRVPDLPPSGMTDPEEIDNFYKKLESAHKAWDKLLADDKYRLVISLNPGETVVVANQRSFHGRHGFTSDPEKPRSIIGCYVSQDELLSRFREEGFDV